MYEIHAANKEPLSIVSALLPPISHRDVRADPRLLQRIKHLTQYRLVQGLENQNSFFGHRHGLVMEVIGVKARPANSKTTWNLTMPMETGGLFEVEHNAIITLRLKNQGDCDLHVTLFNLTPRFGIVQLWPTTEHTGCISARGEAEVQVCMDIAPELEPIAGSVPIVDTFKAFATLESTSLASLELVNILEADGAGLKGGSSKADDNLETILNQLTRPPGDGRLAREEILGWQTVEVHVRTLPRGSI